MPNRAWCQITYPFPNSNGWTIDVWQGINNFIPHLIKDGIIHAYRIKVYTLLVKGIPVFQALYSVGVCNYLDYTLQVTKSVENSSNGKVSHRLSLKIVLKLTWSWAIIVVLWIPWCTGNHTHCIVWDEITYTFPNFNFAIVEIWKWISNFIQQSCRACDDYSSMLGLCPALYIFLCSCCFYDDVIKWKHFPRNWPFVRGIHRSPVNSLHKDQWREALMFYLICARINGWVNNREAGDLRRYRAHYDVIVMLFTHQVMIQVLILWSIAFSVFMSSSLSTKSNSWKYSSLYISWGEWFRFRALCLLAVRTTTNERKFGD